jgi:hypothetical protein
MSLQELLADYQAQIERARDRIRMFESGEMSIGDTFPPFKDWTPEAIALEQQIIGSLQSGVDAVRKIIDAQRP